MTPTNSNRISLAVAMSADAEPALRAILESLGALLIDQPKERLSPSDAACIVTMRPTEADSAYARGGGALLAPRDAWPTNTQVVETISTPFSSEDLGWLRDDDKSASRLTLTAVRHGDGWCIDLPGVLIDNYWLNCDIGCKRLCADPATGAYYTENTSLIDKSNVQKAVLLALQQCYLRRGLPFVTKSRYPAGVSNIFCYRLDCDGGSSADFRTTVKALSADVAHQAYFFNVFDYRRSPDLAHLLMRHGGAVESHNFVHYVFADARRESRNIERAHQWITWHTGRAPRGFSCPNFGYNEAALATLDALGYRAFHSFGFDYDTLPHRAIVNGRLSRIWHMSYHPISVSRIVHVLGRLDSKAMHDYYVAIPPVRQRRHDPHFYYCHPEGRIGKHPVIYEWIRDAVMALPGVRMMDQVTYAEYLDRRLAVASRVSFDAANQTIVVANADEWRTAQVGLLHGGDELAPLHVEPRMAVPLVAGSLSKGWQLSVGDTMHYGREASRLAAVEVVHHLANMAKDLRVALKAPLAFEAMIATRGAVRRLMGNRIDKVYALVRRSSGTS